MLRSLVLSLAVTLAVELAAGWLLGLRRGREMAVVALMNVVTNPPVVTVSTLARFFIPPDHRWALIVALELAAFSVEALIIHKALGRSRRGSLGLSGALNGSSYLIGALISRLI